MPLLGLNAKLYWLDDTRLTWGDTDNTDTGFREGEAPIGLVQFVEATAVRDVKYNLEKGTADVTNRGANGWTLTATTLKDASVDVTLTFDPDDTFTMAMIGASLTDATIALAVLDGAFDADGTRGLWADFDVTKYDKDEPLTEGQLITFNIKPGTSAVPPEMVLVVIPI